MPGKMALVNYHQCHPEECDKGICVAALACSHKLLKQEAPYEIPMPQSLERLRNDNPSRWNGYLKVQIGRHNG